MSERTAGGTDLYLYPSEPEHPNLPVPPAVLYEVNHA